MRLRSGPFQTRSYDPSASPRAERTLNDGPSVLHQSTKGPAAGRNGIRLVVCDRSSQGPCRDFDCSNYDTCLGLAAALNWESFSCRGCNGSVNETLIWRVNHRLEKDDFLSAMCGKVCGGIAEGEVPAEPRERVYPLRILKSSNG